LPPTSLFPPSPQVPQVQSPVFSLPPFSITQETSRLAVILRTSAPSELSNGRTSPRCERATRGHPHPDTRPVCDRITLLCWPDGAARAGRMCSTARRWPLLLVVQEGAPHGSL
jgi:hypothetical protein